jgi:hypothetical protein
MSSASEAFQKVPRIRDGASGLRSELTLVAILL